jgi:putative effector of murein hydrolase LrgA (UPF0299 family)
MSNSLPIQEKDFSKESIWLVVQMAASLILTLIFSKWISQYLLHITTENKNSD